MTAEALAALEAHRKRQDEFRQQYGTDYRADLDLVFANPDGSPLRPDSVFSVHFPALPSAEAAARRESAHAAPYARNAYAGGRRAVAGCI